MLRMGPERVLRLCPGQIWALFERAQQEEAERRLADSSDLLAVMVSCNPFGGSASSKIIQDHLADLSAAAGFGGSGYTQEAIPL